MRVAFVVPHVLVCGGIRKILTVANGLIDRGHEVDIAVFSDAPASCSWMEVKANIIRFEDASDYDVAMVITATSWEYLNRTNARLKAWWWLGFEAGYFKTQSWYDAYQQDYFIFANSPWTAQMAEIIYHRKIPVVIGGIDPKLFHPVEVKKEYELLCCAPEDKPEKGWWEMKRAADILGLPLENWAIKNLKQEEVATEYSKAKIFIAMPTLEGAYNPTLEAMACGLPCIISDCGGITHYARNEENCLVIPRHTGALIQAIERLRNDQELQNKFIKNGLDITKTFTWEKCIDDIEALLTNALDKQVN